MSIYFILYCFLCFVTGMMISRSGLDWWWALSLIPIAVFINFLFVRSLEAFLEDE